MIIHSGAMGNRTCFRIKWFFESRDIDEKKRLRDEKKNKIEERIKMQNEMENITKPVSQQQNPTKK